MTCAEPWTKLAGEAASLHAGKAGTVLFGVAGGVGVGKSSVAALLQDRLAALGLCAEVVGTDSFLMANAELRRRGLTLRKGYPESFDVDALEVCLSTLSSSSFPVRIPVYSHATYDRVQGRHQTVERCDVAIVEGVNALRDPVARHLDISLYLDAAEADIESWFVERFLQMCDRAAGEQESFYRAFLGMDRAGRRSVAEMTWREINLPNLLSNIVPSRSNARFVATKGPDHRIVSLTEAD